MADNHDYVALDWVRGEIEQTLLQARTALESFVDTPDDSTQLTFCLNYIHQVHGTLQMVEFYGASLLAEEMEQLCQALIDGKVSNQEESLEVLMEALLQLQNYLEHIQAGQKDLPVVLLPTLNDLRATQGRPLLSDTSLFTPDLLAAQAPSIEENHRRMEDPQVIANLRKLRQMYQVSLVGVIRNQDLAENFSYLYKVLARLEKFCHDTPIGKLWWISVGFVDAVQASPDNLGSAVKHLLRELDHWMKEMIDHPQDILTRDVPVDLLKNLLYYVAKTDTSTKRVDALKDAFSLSVALPSQDELDEERQKLQGPDEETMSSVASALGDELSQVKDQLDLFVRDKHNDTSALTELLPTLNQVANTLAVLGNGADRSRLLKQVSRIEDIVKSGETDNDQALLEIAGDLLQVESSLNASGRQQATNGENNSDDNEFVVPIEQFESAHNAVIFESKNGLEQAKNSIIGFIASKWDHAEIEGVPDLLDSIRGGLQIIPLTKAASLLGSCSQFIRESILNEKVVPDWEQLDRLADAITSIEYYMERLTAGASGNDKILDMAEQSLVKLGALASHNEGQSLESADHHIAEVASESPEAMAKESDEALIDEEILEIFVEEVDEVMVAIREAVSRLKADSEDISSLEELRRAFHTLKGSGRLVGATEIGEMGWSIENLLNKYIEKSHGLEFEDFTLLDLAQSRLPAMVEGFTAGTSSAVEINDIVRLAESQLSALGIAVPVQDSASEQSPEVNDEPVTADEVKHVAEAPVSQSSNVLQPAADEDEDSLIDEEILEIFIEEAEEVCETISNFLPVFLEQFDNQEALTELRRAYHTLKGSGRMVGAADIGETAWGVENMLNRVIDGSILMSQDIADLVKYVSELIPKLVVNFRDRTPVTFDLEKIQAHADALSKGDFVPTLSTLSFDLSADNSAAQILDSDVKGENQLAVGVDETLLDIFESEVRGHIAAVDRFVEQAKTSEDPVDIDDSLSRALHTLKGSAKTACIDCIAEVAIPTEKFVKELRARQLAADERTVEILAESIELIKEGLGVIKTAPNTSLVGTSDYLSKLGQLQGAIFDGESQLDELEGAGGQDPQLVSMFLTEGLDILLDAEKILGEWQENPSNSESLSQLYGEVKTLHRGAKIAGLESIAELCECIESCYDYIDSVGNVDETLLSEIKRAHEVLIDMMDQVAAGLTAVPDNQLLAVLRGYIDDTNADDALNEKLEELDKELDEVIPQYQQDEEAKDTDEELDEELIEIFLEEARDIVSSLPANIERVKEADSAEQALHQLERDFHTLKGGARMACVEPIGDLSHVLETLFNRLVLKQSPLVPDLFEVLEASQALLQSQLLALESKSEMPDIVNLLADIESYDVRAAEAKESEAPLPEALAEEKIEPESIETPEPEGKDISSSSGVSSRLMDLDPELVEIFLEEARDIIDNSGSLLHQWETDTHNLDLVAELQRELHTLKGGARMAEVGLIGDIAHELETLFERIVDNRFGIDLGMIKLCLSCHDALANMVEAVASGQALPDASELLTQIKSVVETGSSVSEAPVAEVDTEEESLSDSATDISEDLDGDLLPLFLDESKDILTAISECLDQWTEDERNDNAALVLQREVHTLKGGARLADIDAIADLAEAAEDRLSLYVSAGREGRTELIKALIEMHSVLDAMLDSLMLGKSVRSRPKLVDKISTAGLSGNRAAGGGAISDQISNTNFDDPELDLEVLEIFVEEARELSEALEEQISGWSSEPTNDDFNRELQRVLHTLKGGARLSDLKELADESHDLETLLVEALSNQTAFSDDLKAKVLERQDRILKLIDEMALKVQGDIVPDSSATVEPSEPDIDKVVAEKAESEPVRPKEKEPSKASAPKKSVVAKKAKQSAPAVAPKLAETAKAAPQETIRVSSGLLEELVNLAGETSISRGRLETQISNFGFTLEEMAATIDRLREQLRRMEMETEAQVLFRAEKEGFSVAEYDDFDPLEMDRYSSIQQLSRSLTESATDLMELRESLADRTRGAETLLLQQSRINSELQENLMKTRMIPFSSMVPRLRRIARQISGELDKQVDFDVTNAEGEMDRSVLERMIAPLEHMLRNALDHGIEIAADRIKAGKPEAGKVTLSLSREGGDVVLRMRDDGGGINDEKVREKAISQGLVSADANASRHDILQFIMLPGFSTAEKVTQISGRGVGMDVVASEIKQMGGTIEIDSTFGKGTEFTVRLPFTVSVNRALMVNTGDDFYAIPLNTIEGIVRVSPFELEEYYKPDAPLYEYAGRQYELQYLGKLLHSVHQPKLHGQPLPLPVILVRGSDKPMALQVDSLMGSREIVVKSLGSQFGGVHAVSGATILGDGSVVVILDLPALIRDESAGILDSAEDIGVYVDKVDDTPLVMVIDDSVTVRKVTTRLLERNGMEVVTAKDGVDAIAQLQDIKPDVMLLDIEMPRMDGFEVATLVRHDERLKDVPIIMITSRTGQKHRERALSIGVNEYLGKPFQEKDLLETIETMTLLK